MMTKFVEEKNLKNKEAAKDKSLKFTFERIWQERHSFSFINFKLESQELKLNSKY